MRRALSILSIVFVLAAMFSIAHADVVPGAVLHLDASNNPAHPDAWTNLGTAGGEVPAGEETPILESGAIDVPGLGLGYAGKQFYTCTKSGQTFGGPEGTNPELALENWTFEALIKRNGDVLFKEHWVFGFTLEQWGVIAAFLGQNRQEGGELFTTRPVAHKPHNIHLELEEWTWIAFGSDVDGSVFYQDGELVDEDGAFIWQKTSPLKFVCIFCGHYGDPDDAGAGRGRSFNGSFAVVRIYDKVLSQDEIMQNITAGPTGAAVDPGSKLAATWGTVKTRY